MEHVHEKIRRSFPFLSQIKIVFLKCRSFKVSFSFQMVLLQKMPFIFTGECNNHHYSVQDQDVPSLWMMFKKLKPFYSGLHLMTCMNHLVMILEFSCLHLYHPLVHFPAMKEREGQLLTYQLLWRHQCQMHTDGCIRAMKVYWSHLHCMYHMCAYVRSGSGSVSIYQRGS